MKETAIISESKQKVEAALSHVKIRREYYQTQLSHLETLINGYFFVSPRKEQLQALLQLDDQARFSVFKEPIFVKLHAMTLPHGKSEDYFFGSFIPEECSLENKELLRQLSMACNSYLICLGLVQSYDEFTQGIMQRIDSLISNPEFEAQLQGDEDLQTTWDWLLRREKNISELFFPCLQDLTQIEVEQNQIFSIFSSLIDKGSRVFEHDYKTSEDRSWFFVSEWKKLVVQLVASLFNNQYSYTGMSGFTGDLKINEQYLPDLLMELKRSQLDSIQALQQWVIATLNQGRMEITELQSELLVQAGIAGVKLRTDPLPTAKGSALQSLGLYFNRLASTDSDTGYPHST